MNKLLAGLAVILVIAALSAGLVHYLSLDETIRRAIEHDAREALQADVRVKRVRISPTDGTGFITGLTVGNPAGFKSPTAITVRSIAVAMDVASLGKQAIVIRTLSVATPQLNYERGPAGNNPAGNNFAKLLENSKIETRGEPGRKFIVERVVLHEAKLRFDSPANPGQTLTLDLPDDIRISNVGGAAGGATSREFATAILETLVYHVNRKIPAGTLQGAAVAPSGPGIAAEK